MTAKIRRIKWETNVSYRYQAAASIGVSHVLVICWHALPESFNNINIKTLPCYSADQGHCGQLESMKEELLAWIFERREMGLVVSTLSIIIKACCLLPLIEQKSAITCYFVTRRFLKNTRLCSAWGRRCCSIPPARCAKRRRSSRTLSVQCTKDRSMIYAGSSTWTRRQYFFNASQKMLEILGKKTVVIRTSTNNTRRATVALTITAGGNQLVPMVVFVITLLQVASQLTPLSASPTAVNSTNTPSRKRGDTFIGRQ